MNFTRIYTSMAAVAVLLCTTGCFRVSSETRALRDAALEFGVVGAEEKIELGVGFFTVGLAKLGTRFVEMPPEARSLLGAVKGVECSVYEISGQKQNLAEVLWRADEAMGKQGCERVVGVIADEELYAVYIPRGATSHRNLSMSVMVLTQRELICATARGDLEAVMQLGFAKAQEHLPKKGEVAGRELLTSFPPNEKGRAL